MQGQRSHLAQAKKCHQRWQVDLDTVCILPRAPSLFKGDSNDDNETAGIGEYPATETQARTDKPNFPELPADEPPVLVEHGEGYDKDNHENTPSFKARWREYFPCRAGQALRRQPTTFELLRNAQVARGESIWGMFSDEGDWKFARWILESGTTQASTDELLKLKKVSERFVVEYTTYQSVADSR